MNGYSSDNGSAQFHPLFPLLAAPLVKLGVPPLISLTLVNTLASFGLLIVFYKLALLDLDDQKSTFAILMILCSPFAFALFIPYSESLFIFLAALSMYWARSQRWWLAGIAAAMATLTRQQGIFLLLPLAWELWDSSERNWTHFWANFSIGRQYRIPVDKRIPHFNRLTGWSLGLVPIAYTGWILFRAFAIGDVSMNFTSMNAFVYSLLISPNAVRVVPFQEFMWPWQALAAAFHKLWHDADVDIITNLFWGAYYLILLAVSWCKLRTSYRLYCVAITFVSFSYNTGSYHPYMGLIRHLLLGFPVFIGFVNKINLSILGRLLLTSLGLVGFVQLIFLFVMKFWIP